MRIEKHKNIVVAALAIVVAVGGYLFFVQEKVGHSELFSLKVECSTKASKYAADNTNTSAVADVNWQVLYSDYIVDRKSCFAEFQKSLFFRISGESKEYLYIYDLLTGQTMASLKLTFEESWEDEVVYQKVRKEIFGRDRK